MKDGKGVKPGAPVKRAAPPAKRPPPVPWIWTPEGVLQAGIAFTFAPRVPGQVLEYSERLLEVTEAFSAVLAARVAFASGRAPSYAGAFESARLLCREYHTAERVLGETAREIAVFFKPEGVLEGISGPLLKRFVEETLERMKP